MFILNPSSDQRCKYAYAEGVDLTRVPHSEIMCRVRQEPGEYGGPSEQSQCISADYRICPHFLEAERRTSELESKAQGV